MSILVRFDWAIKRLLRNKANFSILEGFLSELLKEDIKIVQVLESESNRSVSDDKQNRVDLLVENSLRELIIIEIQQNNERDYFQRMVYTTSKLVTEQLHKGDGYEAIKRVISINIVYFDLGQGKDYIYRGTTQFKGMHQGDTLQLTARQEELYRKVDVSSVFPEYYILKVNNFNDVAKDSLDEWVYFLKNSEVKADFRAKGIQQAREELDIMKLNETDRKQYEAYLHYQRVRINEVQTSHDEGVQQGIEQGIEQGIQKGIYKVAKAMKEKGIEVAVISETTGLSEVEISRL